MTATAVSELSLDPPSMLVCVNRSTALYGALDNGTQFCINMLAQAQQEISVLCGGMTHGAARFEKGNWDRTDNDAPYLADAEAVFICRQTQRVAFGTHEIFIGQVEQVMTSGDPDPLIYVGGRYASIAAASAQLQAA